MCFSYYNALFYVRGAFVWNYSSRWLAPLVALVAGASAAAMHM